MKQADVANRLLLPSASTNRFDAVSYLTVAVGIDQGRVSATGAAGIASKTFGLLGVLNPPPHSIERRSA